MHWYVVFIMCVIIFTICILRNGRWPCYLEVHHSMHILNPIPCMYTLMRSGGVDCVCLSEKLLMTIQLPLTHIRGVPSFCVCSVGGVILWCLCSSVTPQLQLPLPTDHVRMVQCSPLCVCSQPVHVYVLSAETFRKRFTNDKGVGELQKMLEHMMEGVCVVCATCVHGVWYDVCHWNKFGVHGPPKLVCSVCPNTTPLLVCCAHSLGVVHGPL